MNDVVYCHLCDEYSITEDGATVCWSCEMVCGECEGSGFMVEMIGSHPNLSDVPCPSCERTAQATQLLIEGGLL